MANQRVLFFNEDEPRAKRQRSELLLTFSQRHEREYARPAWGPGSPEYEAYYAGFYEGNAALPRSSREYVSDEVTRLHIDGYRVGALLRPTTIDKAPEATRTRDGSLASEAFGKSVPQLFPSRSIAR